MGLYFYNRTNEMVQIVFAHYDPNCEGDVKWRKKGWWRIAPGQTVKVWSGRPGGQKFLYYAENSFGQTWAGDYFTQIPGRQFDWCWNLGSTDSRNLGLALTSQISSTSMDHTIKIQ